MCIRDRGERARRRRGDRDELFAEFSREIGRGDGFWVRGVQVEARRDGAGRAWVFGGSVESRRARAPRERHRVGENRMGAFRGVVKRTTRHVDDHGVVRG